MTKETTRTQQLANLMADLPAIPADKENPYYGSKYTSLGAIIEAVSPVLAKHGFAVLFKGGTETIEAQLMGEDDHLYASASFPIDGSKGPQARGSEFTYARRYLMALLLNLNVGDEDDDGNAAQDAHKAAPRPAMATADQIKEMDLLIEQTGADVPAFLEWLTGGTHISDIDDLTFAQAERGIAGLKVKAGTSGQG